jgi:hypothetical protein
MQYDALIGHQYRLGKFAIGDDLHGPNPPRRVTLTFEDYTVTVRHLDGKGKPRANNIFFPTLTLSCRVSGVSRSLC